jgi:hypothetical protein
MRSAGALLACALVISLQAAPAAAQESTGEEAGYGVASGLCSLLYAPVKVVYALGGFLIGGLAFGLSAGDGDVWNAVVTPAVRGDYVVTPSHLRGEEPLEFIGRNPEPAAEYSAPSYGEPTYP